MDLVCSGTLHTRRKVCGKKTCRCHTDPEARHGPYHEWSRLEDGRLRHTVLKPEEVEKLKRAIENKREISSLLREWEQSSMKIIRGKTSPKA
ncbi:MAG: hypothetical protein D6679_04535 [Candidatus Hydrogenedentota bacterium]|nr:MAG: hypothetical protein D6679_04535 [Candidatus Hydrogenedentota bacterium]